VVGYIEKQVAYLSGGRGEDSSVIITLPECSAFSDIPEESLAKVLTYLTLIPRQPGVKFIIILDRRLDTWGSIKTALGRIAASFPGNLHLVLVLRPTSFFQRTVTDLGFRFSQEDFMLKMPVVMLSSVTDLLRYIDENQLTSEFGGTLDYCHSDWIVLRTAIESFAVTVKDIAQMLQSFGTDLAETELTDEGGAIECLLKAHTDKSVSKEGRHLLSILESSGNEEDCHWDVRLDWDTVQRLLSQLRDMESAFDGFFEKHHLKLLQCIQLLRYEKSFQEKSLQGLTSQEKELSSSAETLAQAEQALKELESLDSQEVMGGAQIVILHGHQLAASHHYALALIVQRCNELRHHCDTLSSNIHKYVYTHTHTHTLSPPLCPVQAQTWCDDGAYLLANQLVERFQSKEGALAALRDIERFLEGAPSMLSSGPEALLQEYEAVLTPQLQVISYQTHTEQRYIHVVLYGPSPRGHTQCHVLRELIETERVYVEELLSVLLGYRAEMDNPSLWDLLPPILRSKRDILFGNMPEIYNFHSRVFLQDLEGCIDTPERVGACFLEQKENFQMYECFCQNKLRSEALWRQFSDCAFFQECQKKLEHKLGLDSYLLKPVQRITKYQLLLKELLKCSTGSEDTSELQGALAAMLELLKSVNDSMHQIAITGYEGELCELGRVLMQGSFSVWISHKKGPTRMKELARFKPMQRHLFLYERALLFCKRREEHGEGCDKTPSYSFKHCLKMSAVGITENVKGDVKKFEIWYSGREEVYVIQAPTVEVKMTWLNELRRILTSQQKLLKGACGPPEWSPGPGAACRGWTLCRCRPTSFCACVPGAPAPGAPAPGAPGSGHNPATSPSATDPPRCSVVISASWPRHGPPPPPPPPVPPPWWGPLVLLCLHTDRHLHHHNPRPPPPIPTVPPILDHWDH
uniref:MCF.2 cell line derived transforming sequence n=1 Tax=Gadus morhua TaxID=8049 RepID=A0A8C5ATH1_GADMO